MQCSIKVWNLKVHIQRKQSDNKLDVPSLHHLPSVCTDRHKGLFAVTKSFSDTAVPIHVMKNTHGQNPVVVSESTTCRNKKDIALSSSLMSFECCGLLSCDYTHSFSSSGGRAVWYGRTNGLDTRKRKCVWGTGKWLKHTRPPLSKEVKLGNTSNKAFLCLTLSVILK